MPRKGLRRPQPGSGRKRGQPPGPRKPRPKQKNAETYRFCIRLYHDGHGAEATLRMIQESYGVSVVTAHRWMKEAIAVVRSLEPPTDDRIRALREETREAFEDNFQRARALDDVAQANRAMMERAKLYGLYAPIEVKHGGEVKTTPTATAPDLKSAELRNEIGALSDRIRAIENEERPSSTPTDASGRPPASEPT
jgi:hypothetical protein